MCFNLFKKKPITGTITPDTKPLTIPHPEEPPNYDQTVNNVSFDSFLLKWFETYNVPTEYRPFWMDKIVVELTDEIPYPAGTWEQDGVRHLAIRPEYLNPGVIAHEQAHNSYSLLTDTQKQEFSLKWNIFKDTDPLLRLIYSTNGYGLTNPTEGHAEAYRYGWDKIPAVLKPYYPRL